MSLDSEPEIIFKWTNLCRLCLSSDSHIDLFSSEVISQDCLSKIRSCLNLLVYCGDPMPSKLCLSCHVKLDEWCKFKKECIQSESNVKKRLQPYKDIKFVKDYFERCAKFESSEIVSSSSKSNTNTLQIFEEINSSVSTQEHQEETNHQENSPDHVEEPHISCDIESLKSTSKVHLKLSCSSTKNVDVKSKNNHSEDTLESGSINPEQVSENLIVKKGWAGNESSLLGTIVSVTGSASDLWNSQHQNKQVEESNYFSIDTFSKEEKTKSNQFDCFKEEKVCSICGVRFVTKEDFDLHVCCMIGSSTNVEDECHYEGHFEDSISFESEYDETELYTIDEHSVSESVHNVKQLKITPWKCLACKLYFQSSLDLRRHYSSASCLGKKVRALDCEFCFRQFLSLNDLLQHQVVHISVRLELTEDDLLCCSQCGFPFPDEKRLRNHLLVHTLKKKIIPIKFTCSDCGQVFLQKDLYEDHCLTHTQMQGTRERTPEAEMEPDFEVELNPKLRPTMTPPHEGGSTTILGDAHSPGESKKPQGAIRCFRCGQMFGSVKQLERHEAIKHKNPTPYICRKCCLRFSARSQLLMHLRVHMSKSSSKTSLGAEANEQTNCCTVCDAKFLLESDLESHMKTHKLPSSEPSSPTAPPTPTEETESNSDMFARYKCSLCARLYVRAASCIRHGQQSHKGQKVVPLRLKRSIFLGRRTSGGKVKHKCPKCPKYFFSFNAFSVHVYRNHGLKMPNPSEDPSSLETEETPDSPKMDEVESKCPFCSKDIKPSYISLHIKKFHRGEVLDPAMIEKDIPTDSCICRYCFKTCSTPHNRKLHESIHYPVKAERNQCETCGQKFVEKDEYEEHTRTCKSIRCGKCHKIFFKFINLTQHSCSGTKSDEAHKCTVCLSAFTSLDLLQIHIKNFHGKKPEQTSPQPGTSRNVGKRLERELWREEANKIVCMVGEKFYCTFCDCEFSTVQESNEHRAAHPRGNWYAVQISDSLFQCTICDKFFETRKSSLLHINYHKKNLLPEQPKALQLSLEPEVEILTDVKSTDSPKVKKYNCRYCSAGFKDSEDLQSHIFHTHVNQT